MVQLNPLVALSLIVLAIMFYYAVQKLGTILAQHLERQELKLDQQTFILEACLQKLTAIQESLKKPVQ